MATQDKYRIFNVKGKLAFGVTDMSTAYPHGGTALGYTSACVFAPNIISQPLIGMEFGEGAFQVIRTEGSGVFTAVLRQWDNDALNLHWPSTSLSNGERVITNTTSYQALRASAGVALAFTPDEPTHPGIIMYNAIPAMPAVELRFNLSDELNMGLTYYCLENASSKIYEITPVSEMNNP